MNRFTNTFMYTFLLLLKFFVKTEIGQTSRIYKVQHMYANSNEGMVFKLVVSLGQGGKKEPVENPPRLGLICFKTFHLNLKKKSILNLLHIYVVVLTLGTRNPCNRRYFLHIPLCNIGYISEAWYT